LAFLVVDVNGEPGVHVAIISSHKFSLGLVFLDSVLVFLILNPAIVLAPCNYFFIDTDKLPFLKVARHRHVWADYLCRLIEVIYINLKVVVVTARWYSEINSGIF